MKRYPMDHKISRPAGTEGVRMDTTDLTATFKRVRKELAAATTVKVPPLVVDTIDAAPRFVRRIK